MNNNRITTLKRTELSLGYRGLKCFNWHNLRHTLCFNWPNLRHTLCFYWPNLRHTLCLNYRPNTCHTFYFYWPNLCHTLCFFTGQIFAIHSAETGRQASRCQQAFSKPCLVNLISNDTHLAFSIYWLLKRRKCKPSALFT